MAAIEFVSDKLYTDADGGDVEMKSTSVSEGSDASGLGASSQLSASNSKLVGAGSAGGGGGGGGGGGVVDPDNEELQIKFSVTGTSSRPHHSGKRKVVRILPPSDRDRRHFFQI